MGVKMLMLSSVWRDRRVVLSESEGRNQRWVALQACSHAWCMHGSSDDFWHLFKALCILRKKRALALRSTAIEHYSYVQAVVECIAEFCTLECMIVWLSLCLPKKSFVSKEKRLVLVWMLSRRGHRPDAWCCIKGRVLFCPVRRTLLSARF